jgi:ABC-type multidrug transport system ATPase subunit
VTYRKNIAYVMQDDSLMATATPREALLFSGKMRLPSSVSTEAIEKKVDQLLEELGLTECAGVMIGGPLIKGISGGQRKRTSVGVELITDPSVGFCVLTVQLLTLAESSALCIPHAASILG